jgi:hypothetical protein
VKNMIAFIVGVLAIVAGAGFLISQTQERAESAELAQAISAAQLETIRQIMALTPAPDDKVGYDKQQAVRKHLEAIDALRKKYPSRMKPDAFILEMEAKASAGQKDKAKTAEYRTRYDYAKQMFDDYLKGGGAKPILTGHSNGMRIDVVSMKPSNEGGEEGLRWDILIWGAPPKDQLNLTGIEIGSVIHFTDNETSGKRKGQPKRTVVRQNMSPAMPYVLLDKPWEWMPDWPMGVMAGYYVGVPKFDSRTNRAFFTLTGQMRTVGGTTVPVEIKWDNVPVESSWKGSPGGKFDTPDLQPLEDEQMKGEGVELERIDPVTEEAPPPKKGR